MKRRKFLALLGLAPIAAVAGVKMPGNPGRVSGGRTEANAEIYIPKDEFEIGTISRAWKKLSWTHSRSLSKNGFPAVGYDWEAFTDNDTGNMYVCLNGRILKYTGTGKTVEGNAII